MDADPGANIAEAEPSRWPLKPLIVAFALIKTVLVIGLAIAAIGSSGGDKAGSAMASGFFFFAVVYWLLLVLPPILLARKGKHLGFALSILLLPDVIGIALFMGL